MPSQPNEWRQHIQQFIDRKTKPPGSLGRLEELALQIALLQESLRPNLAQPRLWVFAADHGVATQGVSAYPQDVTWQMVNNFLAGGAAINAFARQHGLPLQVVDVGVKHNFAPHPNLVQAKVRFGSGDFTQMPAMTALECQQAMEVGRQLVAAACSQGSKAVLLGEMGIGNTTAASALMARLLDLPAAACVGAGTGLDAPGQARKLAVVEKALQLHDRLQTPLEILAALGGLEIAAMAGAMLEAGRCRALIVVDGFIAGSAFLAAWRMMPELAACAVFSHCSAERGHRAMLERLGVTPILDLGLRLGEGTGAALAWPILEAATRFLREMASFDDAGVSESP
jgi:nicotinate-nucleotide--dimethylbenzimidazole phosphoribosyltransferase